MIVNTAAVRGAALKFVSDDGDTEFADLVNEVLARRFPDVEFCDSHDELNLCIRGNNMADVCSIVDAEAESVWESSPDVLRALLNAIRPRATR